jgi:hypothetical protein
MTPDDEIVQALTEELEHKRAPLELLLQPASALQLAGLVQLATRHPGVAPNLAATARAFLAGVREYFAECPMVLEVLRRGDDPREDRS